MDDTTIALAESLVIPRYVQAGAESLRHFHGVLRSLVAQRRCPHEGLPDSAIEQLMHQLALMDTNNFAHHIGGGEREGRVVCGLVRRRHYNLTHGIGRSGDLTADQPKAAGSSLLYQLTNLIVLDVLRLAGAASTQAALVVPMATGMTLALALRCVAKQREVEARKAKTENGADTVVPRYVLWLRIDQKTALKCIDAAGLVPYAVPLDAAPRQTQQPRPSADRAAKASADTKKKETKKVTKTPTEGEKNDKAGPPGPHPFFICSRVERLAEAFDALGGRDKVLCVLSTTSCFAPRLPDDTLAIARFCKERDIAHIVNNAYGVQSRAIMSRLDAAQRLGRVDAVVQSTDKNFLVPVGGAVLSSPSKDTVHAAAALYAGRASATPAMDLFMTCLSLGQRGMLKLWKARYVVRDVLQQRLRHFAKARHEELISEHDSDGLEDETGGVIEKPMSCGPDVFPHARSLPRNDISFAMTMRHYRDVKRSATSGASDPTADAKAFGAKLFRSAVTGPRVVFPAPETATTIAGCTFRSYGMHQDAPPCACPLLVVACAIGMTEEDVTGLMERLEELWPVPATQQTTTTADAH